MLKTAAQSLLAAAVLGGFMFSGVAYARDAVFTAKLTAPTEQSRVVTSNTLWSCEGDTCVARTSDVSVRTCRQFTREAGLPVASFGTDARQLTSEELARCNEGVAANSLQAQN